MWDGLPGGTALVQEGKKSSAPLSTLSAQAASAGANSPSLSSPLTAASGSNSEAAATGLGRASLQSMKVLRMKKWEESDMGSLGILEPAPQHPWGREEIKILWGWAGMGSGVLGS